MGERVLQGAPASPGLVAGCAWRRTPDKPHEKRAAGDPKRERETAMEALARAAQALSELAATLPAADAEIVEAGALMAGDPALISLVDRGIDADGLAAADAILAATAEMADAIAAIDDETLAARADDVRSLGRRAAALTGANGTSPGSKPPPDAILIATDVGPADVAELAPSLAGVALAGGGATAHAAIVARSLGVPMVTGLPDAVLGFTDRQQLVLDGSAGTVVAEPAQERVSRARDESDERHARAAAAAATRDRPATTSDGERIAVLANVASAAELALALSAGAEGVGLLRTELAFLDAVRWPSEDDHRQALRPIIAKAGAHRVIVRVLDIGPDKCPPFARGSEARGIALLLEHESALLDQLRAIAACAPGADVRVLLPMVEHPDEILRTRALLARVEREPGDGRAIPLGAMIETRAAASRVAEIARHSDFLSIGTNDLTASVLGLDRFSTNAARTHDPAVLTLIAATVAAARDRGIAVEVCGEAASDPGLASLLIGLGVTELSVGAARVGDVRGWIRTLARSDAERLAESALRQPSAGAVEALLSAQRRHGRAERVDRGSGIHTLGA